MKSKLIILAITLLIFNNSNFAQYGWGSRYDPDDVIGEQLYTQVKSVLGEQYTVWYYVLDSMFNKDYTYDEIIDPYNQFQGKVFFISHPVYESDRLYPPYYESSYSRPDSSVVGIFSNGSIIWHSEPISLVKLDTIKYGLYHDYSIPDEIFAIKDINRDGKVDILLITDALWIISWDGTTGTIINDMDPIYGSSKLFSTLSYELIDNDGDGILEILSYWYDFYKEEVIQPDKNIRTLPYVSYGWDGEKYGLWDDVVQLGLNEYPVVNKLTATVKCEVRYNSEDDSLFIYKYVVHNDDSSLQQIRYVILDNMTESKFIDSVNNPWSSVKGFDSTGVSWKGISSNERINPGSTKSGFGIISKRLPRIIKFFLRGVGDRVAFNPDLDNKDYSFDVALLNFRTKSFSGYTIAPVDISDSLTNIGFVDSLLNLSIRSYDIGWITNQTTANKYDSLFNAAKTQLQQNNNNAAKATLQTVLQQVDLDSTNNLTSEAYALLRYNTEYLIEQIPQSSPNLLVNLKNSLGNQIPASNVMYYDASWKDAVNNGDGTFTVITTKPTVSVRVFYEGANQTVNNVPAQNNTYTFTTVNAAVQLKNSSGNLIDVGTVQYYAGAWRDFGTTVNGVANKELLPVNYSFRMTYENGSQDKQQNLSADPTVVFQTVNAAVQLKNSLGNLIPAPMGDQGTVQYYAGAWRSFGTTVNGIATKELLPVNYSFRMTYEYVSNDKQQNLSTNSTVTFSTILCTVKVTNANNQPLEGAATKYYSLSWRDIGLTNANGITTKELLPSNISFRASYGNVGKDKQQDIGVNSLVEILLSIP